MHNWTQCLEHAQIDTRDGGFDAEQHRSLAGGCWRNCGAMVGSIFRSDAWNNVTFIAGEMKNPKRNIGLSLFWGR